jgi:hypothetical protein
MRLLLTFLIGLFSFFYLSDFFLRAFKIRISGIIGVSIIIIGFLVGFWGQSFIAPPLHTLTSLFLIGSGIGLTFHHLLSQRYVISEKFEKNLVRKHESAIDRILEILPGALTWTALTSPFWLSLTLPFAVAYLIIIADVYWLTNSLKIAVMIYHGYRKMDWAKKQPWRSLLQQDFPNQWNNYSHLILLPTYKESLEVLKPAFDGIANSNLPKDRIILCVGFEERVNPRQFHKETIKYLEQLSKEINVIMSFHPAGLTGEIPGPGTNRNWMVKTSVQELKKQNIDPKNVLVTTLDGDFVIHPEFLGGALHKYLSTPAEIRDKRSFTGAFLYYNNYWQAPTPTRLIASGTAFWQMAEMVGSDKYQNFSSLSINMQSLLDVGLWIPNKVNDDSGFYWKAYFHFKGDYKVIPHFMPLNGDTVLDENLIKTFQNQYLQLKRWAYGVEHIPFIVKQYFKRTDIDFWDKTDKLLFVMWANTRWGFLALFITFGGLLIPVINPQYHQSVLAINLPIVSSWIMTAAFLGLFSTIYVHEKTVPPRPKSWSVITRVWSYIQWLLVPIVLVTISTVPAIDAQTSLMIGRYLEYRTTNKARKET